MKVIEELSEYILFLEIIFLKYIIDEGNYKKVKDILDMDKFTLKKYQTFSSTKNFFED